MTRRFSATEAAAKSDRLSKWSLIEAIAADAQAADVGISSTESILAAKDALTRAGNEQSDGNVQGLCVVAKYDAESTFAQRRIWRRYGWTSIRAVAKFGMPHDQAEKLLGEQRLSVREIEAVVRGAKVNANPGKPVALDVALAAWANKMNNLLMAGAELAAEADEAEGLELGAHASMALMIYERITERKLDVEIRELFEEANA